MQAKRAIGSRQGIKIAGSMPPLKASYRPDEVGEFDDMLVEFTLSFMYRWLQTNLNKGFHGRVF